MGEQEKKEAKAEIAKLKKEIKTLSKDAKAQKDMLNLVAPIFNAQVKDIEDSKNEMTKLLRAAESSRKGEDIAQDTIGEFISNNNAELKKLVKSIPESKTNLKIAKLNKDSPKHEIDTKKATVDKQIRLHGTRITIKIQLENIEKKMDTATRLLSQVKSLTSGINKAGIEIDYREKEIKSLQSIVDKPEPPSDKKPTFRNLFK